MTQLNKMKVQLTLGRCALGNNSVDLHRCLFGHAIPAFLLKIFTKDGELACTKVAGARFQSMSRPAQAYPVTPFRRLSQLIEQWRGFIEEALDELSEEVRGFSPIISKSLIQCLAFNQRSRALPLDTW